jgi:hypothetical protein
VRHPVVLLVAVVAIVASALFARAVAARAPTSFRTPDAGAACRVKGPALVCSSLGSEGSLALRGAGAPRVTRVLPWWDASTPVLHTFHRGTISCELRKQAIVCRNRGATIRVDGAGFAVVL